MTSPAVPNLEHTYPWEYMPGLLRGHENNIKMAEITRVVRKVTKT